MFEQMKGLPPKKKVEYFLQYYGVITAIIIIGMIVVISFIHSRLTMKDEAGGIMMVNAAPGNEQVQQAYLDDILEEEKIDTRENTIAVHSNLYFTDNNGAAQSEVANVQIMQALIMSQSIDVIMADESYHETFVESDYLGDLRDYLDAGLLEKYQDRLVYGKDMDTGEEIVSMIKIPEDSSWIGALGWYPEGGYMGIAVNTKRPDIAKHILLRALGEEPYHK